MLTIWGRSANRTCEGPSRRDFLRIGALGGAGLTLPNLLRARAAASAKGQPTKDTAVIWLWLGGGATQIETFDPKMNAPTEFRSTVGAVDCVVPGMQIGGLFPRMATVANHMAIVRSFAHRDSGHRGGTHFVMTGYDHPPANQNVPPIRPSIGAITSRVRGPNHPGSGIPTFVRLSNIYGDGASFLGTGATPFDSAGQARKNMSLSIDTDRLADRRALLADLDRLDRHADCSGDMDGLDEFEGQAFNLVLSEAKDAFDISQEDQKLRDRYGKGLGEQLLLARRLCEAGCGFVNVNYGGWDMHQRIASALQKRAPALDQAVSALVEDLVARGLNQRVLLAITGEFGRTPRINRNGGRDHWAPLSPLAFACGGLRTGQVVGESSAKAEGPKTSPFGPQDLLATVLHVLGIPQDTSFHDRGGRPTPMVTGGSAIAELI